MRVKNVLLGLMLILLLDSIVDGQDTTDVTFLDILPPLDDISTSLTDPNTFTSSLTLTDNILEGENGKAKSVPSSVEIPTSLGVVKNTEAKNVLKTADMLVEGEFLGTQQSTVIPFYSIPDDSIIKATLDKNEKITIQQFQNNKPSQLSLTLSEGSEITQSFRSSPASIHFTATDPAAFLITKDSSYQFSDGIFVFDNLNIRESITTSDTTELTMDKSNGITKITLAPHSSYQYLDLKKTAGFTLRNPEETTYTLSKITTSEDKNVIDPVTKEFYLAGPIEFLVSGDIVFSLSSSQQHVKGILDDSFIPSSISFSQFTKGKAYAVIGGYMLQITSQGLSLNIENKTSASIPVIETPFGKVETIQNYIIFNNVRIILYNLD